MRTVRWAVGLACEATCSLFPLHVSAQSAPARSDSDPLHQLNNSVRSLVRRVTPSVVHVIVTGYGPVDKGGGDASLVLGKQQKLGSGLIIVIVKRGSSHRAWRS